MDAPAWTPEEHLRKALVDLQKAQRDYIASFSRDVPASPERAARDADEARLQAQRWGALARGASTLEEER